MRRTMVAFAVVMAASATVLPGSARADLRDLLPFGRTHRISQLLPAVVNITMEKLVTDPGDELAPPRREEMFGSGFIIDPSGLIVTNRHVVADMVEISVTLQSGVTLPAKIVGIAGSIDLALLKVDSPKPLPTLKWGDSDHLHIGDQVLAVGNPLGVGESVTSGIVSALNRNIQTSTFDDYIQTDASINHGNSGGPLVNSRGEVMGVDTAIYSPTDTGGSIGIGFAIPANDAEFMVDQLRRFGHLRLGSLGIRTQDVTSDIAEPLGLTQPRGAIVAGVDPGSPAATAGIQEGDVVLGFGKDNPKDARALARLIARAKLGAPIAMTLWRDGHQRNVSVTVAELDDTPPHADGKPAATARTVSADPTDLGLRLAPVTDAERAKLGLGTNASGVIISDVTPNSTAADRAFKAGDLILKVQQDAVHTPDDVTKLLTQVNDRHLHHALVLVRRPTGQQWISLPIGPAP